MDTSLFRLINGLAGRLPSLGHAMSGVSNDYFLPVLVVLIFVMMWFGTRDLHRRTINQKAVLIGLAALGIANALVVITTAFVFRARPFSVLPPDQIHLFYYRPTDSSFPSNYASVLFAAAISMVPYNKRAGAVLLAIATVGSFGRVFIGIHYPSDVLAGVGYALVASLVIWGLARLLNPLIDWLLGLARRAYLA